MAAILGSRCRRDLLGEGRVHSTARRLAGCKPSEKETVSYQIRQVWAEIKPLRYRAWMVDLLLSFACKFG